MKKGENVENTIGSQEFFLLLIHDLLFSPGHPIESEGRFVNFFGNYSPLCGGPPLSLGLATRNNDFELSFASSPDRGWRVTLALCL